MQRVNWEAKSDYEYIQNYKLLQQAFAKNKVQRYVDVDKLIRAKYQGESNLLKCLRRSSLVNANHGTHHKPLVDNLEFCQWLKAFYDQSGVYRPEYDAAGIRSKGKGGKTVGSFLGKTASNYNSKPVSTGTRRTTPAGGTKTSTNGSQPLSVRQSETNTKKSTMSRNNTDQVVADAALLKKNSELSNKVAELESSLVEVEKERDFYFQKLRDIEIMLQVHQEKGEEASNTTTLMDNVFKVLYATAEDPIVVTDEGEVRLSC